MTLLQLLIDESPDGIWPLPWMITDMEHREQMRQRFLHGRVSQEHREATRAAEATVDEEAPIGGKAS